MEEFTERLQHHTGGVSLTIGRISCYMWGAYNYSVQQFLIDIRLVFPYIDNCIGYTLTRKSRQQCLRIDYFATRRVYYIRCITERCEEFSVRQMESLVISVAHQRSVESYHITVTYYLVHPYKAFFAIIGTRRVIFNHSHT